MSETMVQYKPGVAITLLDLSREYYELLDSVASAETEAEYEIAVNRVAERIEQVEESVGAKIAAILRICDVSEMYATQLKESIERVKTVRTRYANTKERLRNYLKLCLEMADIKSIKVGDRTARIQDNGRRSVFVDPSIEEKEIALSNLVDKLGYKSPDVINGLPTSCYKVVIDVKKVKELALEGEIDVKGVEVFPGKPYLVVR